MEKKPYIQFYIDSSFKEKLRQEAKAKGVPLSVFIRLKLQGDL
jgi:hypothetical protein